MAIIDNSKKCILSPISIGKTQLKHRVVLAPLTRLRSSADGVPSNKQLEYYRQRASPGGLLLTECTGINSTAIGYLGSPGVFSEEQIEGWKRITDEVHKKGGSIFVQLWHCGRTGKQELNPNHEQVVSASAIPASGQGLLGDYFETPRALDISEIKSIVQDFRQAALNAVEKAGFDGVEIHSAFGYLLDQFINTSSNIRTDEYGGSKENRCRFTLEVVDAVCNAIGAERISIRVSPGGGKYHSATEDFPIETCTYLISQLQKHHSNMAFVHFMQTRNNRNIDTDEAEVYRSHWKGRIISSGFSSSDVNHAIDHAQKTGDLIAFGRHFISNPDLPERIRYGYPLNRGDVNTFYTREVAGYTDYPQYSA